MLSKRILLVVALLILASVPLQAVPYDFGGETFYIGQSIWFDKHFNWLTRDHFDDPRYAAHMEEVEELFNVNIEWELVGTGYPASAAIDYMLPRIIAGEGNFIVTTGESAIPILVANNLIMPVTEWINEEYFERLPDPFKSLSSFVNFKGENWAFQFGPRMMTEADVVYWNKDLFEELGLPNLYELYEAGEWTWEAMREIAIAVTADTDGDGEIDRFGVSARYGPDEWSLMTRWIWTNGATLAKEIDGKIVFDADSDAAVESFEFWRELIELGVWNPDWYAYRFDDGFVAMHIDLADDITYKRHVECNFGVVPLPKGPRADEHVAIEWRKWVAVLPITAPNPEAQIELWHAIFELAVPYIYDLEEWEDQYWEHISLLVRDEESFENFKWVTQNTQPAVLMDVFASVPGWDEALRQIRHGEKDARTAMAEMKPAVQAYLDEMFDQ